MSLMKETLQKTANLSISDSPREEHLARSSSEPQTLHPSLTNNPIQHSASTPSLPQQGLPTIKLRIPGKPDNSFHGPSPQWLTGKWHISHSTLPTWKDKRNVTITYTLVSPDRLDDKVQFDPIAGGVSSVSGKQVATKKSASNHLSPASSGSATPSTAVSDSSASTSPAQRPRQVRMNTVEAHDLGQSANDDQGEIVEWDWRGQGLIKLASAHWEVLSWGGGSDQTRQWLFTHFKKTVLTPEGVNLYVRDPKLIDEAFLQSIKDAVGRTGDQKLVKLVAGMFTVHQDGR